MKTIVVPVDFSSGSEFLVDKAIDFAKTIGAKISLLHVTPLDVGHVLEEENRQLIYLEHRVVSEKVDCDYILKQGDASSIILEYVDDIKADYIVIGSHGRTGIYEVFIGSITKTITQKSKIPVLVIPNYL
jgi:nucleotide-binding universal stress UspA family protein